MSTAAASFSANDSVYYHRASDGSTIPATVLKCGATKALIRGNFPENEGSRNAWVSTSNLELQEKPEAKGFPRLDPTEWPTEGYIIAVDRVIAQIVDFTEKDQIPAPLQAKTAMASGKVQGCRTVFARQPNTETLAKLMEAGQAAWLAMIPIDPHRKQWDEAYSAWQSAWAIYVRTKPSKPCPDCGKQAQWTTT